MLLGIIFACVCACYTGAWVTGWYLTKHDRLDLDRVVQSRRAFADPVTRRFQQWCIAKKMDAIRRQQWFRLGLLIFSNNLIAVALVGRTLYGIILMPAVYLTCRQGLSQGTFAAQSPRCLPTSLMRLAVLEFGAYLLATALGVNLLIAPAAGRGLREAIAQLIVFYPVVAVALALGAWLEVNELRSKMPAGFELPREVSLEDLRAKALDLMKRRTGGPT